MPVKQLEPFTKKVIANIKKIPKGKVATYGQIAGISGKPQASRAVAWILHSCSKSHRLPWQRVLGAQGKISFPVGSRHYLRQKRLLQKDGVTVSATGRIDAKIFLWKKAAPKAKKGGPGPRLFSQSI